MEVDRPRSIKDSEATRRQVAIIAITTMAYVLAASVFAIVNSNREFVFYIVVMVTLMAFVYGMHLRVGISAGLLWCLSTWGLMHMAGGLLRVPHSWPTANGAVLYNLWLIPGLLKYDQLVHAFGFGITTWLCWQGLRAAIDRDSEVRPQPTFGLMLLCAAGGMGFGAFNEVVEFIATLTIPDTTVGGYANTGWDLVANLVGCAGAAALIGWCTPGTDATS
jgi:hypothetical protein